MGNTPAWRCPFCGHHQRTSADNTHSYYSELILGEPKVGKVYSRLHAIRCLNFDCNELTLKVSLEQNIPRVPGLSSWGPRTLKSWSLLPESSSKPQPDYIPTPLRQDYYEACLIRDNSPKASATLARRCLQGMIRDFCGISKLRLIDEIKELRNRIDDGNAPKGVEHETMDAIDAVREIGNIGAHMEKDISLIVEVDPGEAQALIELIEMLFDEWYIARHTREERLAKIKLIAAEKKDAKLPKPPEPLMIETEEEVIEVTGRLGNE